MSVSKRMTIWTCVIGALMLLAWPANVDAQRRRAPQSTSHAVQRPPGRSAGRPAGRGAWGPYPGYYGAPYYERGSLRIQVKPEDTEVYVDGYYAGVVDSYDGFFQRLHLPAGAHDIELRLEGYRSIQEQVYLTVGSTYRIEHQMEPLAPGETTPPPPAPPVQAEPSVPPSPRQPPDAHRPPPPTAQVSGFGMLAIRVQPDDAVILVNGEEWRSPRMARLEIELGAGRHRVEVRRDGYEGYVTDVEVRAGETTAVNVSLPRD